MPRIFFSLFAISGGVDAVRTQVFVGPINREDKRKHFISTLYLSLSHSAVTKTS